MYATVRRYGSAGDLADAVAENREEILGIFRQIPGFQQYFMVKTGDGTAVSVTVCEDRAGAEATNEAARDYIATRLTHITVGPPEIHVGEVAMHA